MPNPLSYHYIDSERIPNPLQSTTKGLFLGCPIPPLAMEANSRNLRTALQWGSPSPSRDGKLDVLSWLANVSCRSESGAFFTLTSAGRSDGLAGHDIFHIALSLARIHRPFRALNHHHGSLRGKCPTSITSVSPVQRTNSSHAGQLGHVAHRIASGLREKGMFFLVHKDCQYLS